MSKASNMSLISLFFLAVTHVAIASPSIEGHWEGAVTRDGSVQFIAMDFSRQPGEANTRITATIDIPELGMFREPMREVSLDGGELKFRFIYGRFECLLHRDVGEITGANNGWGPPVRIHLKRLNSYATSVQQEEVRFTNGSVNLAGTLIRPRGTHQVPAVVCIHGSAQPTRKTWEYRGIAYVLAQNGFAALIYDRRGNGSSTGSASEATFDDLTADAIAGTEYLKTRNDILVTGIGLFGASQGGWLAPLAASRSNDIAFVIAQTSPAVSVWQQERHSIEYRMLAEGLAPDEIDAALTLSDQIFDFVRTGQGWDVLSQIIERANDETWANYVQMPETPEDAMSWRNQQYDPKPALSKLKTPILVLYAEQDTFVPPAENVDKMKSYLAEAGNRDVTIKVFPDVGHGMELQRALIGDEWKWPTGYWVWPRKAPDYYQTIVEWIEQHVNTVG